MSVLAGIPRTAPPRVAEPAELTRDLYERYGQRVFTFCYSRLRNREAAQDAVQTTFIYVLRALQRGVKPEFELAWLLKIAFNVCRGARRSAGRETAAIQDVEDIDGLAAPAGEALDGSERIEALRDGLAALPDTQRRGILLREWQGLSYAEIADELGLTVSAVETLLFRARRNLASRLQHVRSGVGALDLASLAGISRSLFRGGLLKLGLVGASASIALVPIVASEVTPALADQRADVTVAALNQAGARSVRPRPAPVTPPRGAGPPQSPRAATASARPRLREQPRRVHDEASPAAPVQVQVQAPASSTTPSDASAAATGGAIPSPAPPPPALPPSAVAPPQVKVPDASLSPLELEPVDQLVKTVDGAGVALP